MVNISLRSLLRTKLVQHSNIQGDAYGKVIMNKASGAV
jgi:hypothetical protein